MCKCISQVIDGTVGGVPGVILKITAEEQIFKSCLLRIYEQDDA
jgi:hypothetical protein